MSVYTNFKAEPETKQAKLRYTEDNAIDCDGKSSSVWKAIKASDFLLNFIFLNLFSEERDKVWLPESRGPLEIIYSPSV